MRKRRRYASGGRTYNPLLDPLHYGEGPEHQFFSGSLPGADISGYDNSTPTIPKASSSSNAGNLAATLGAAAKLGKIYQDLTKGNGTIKPVSTTQTPDLNYDFSGGLGNYGAGFSDYASTLGGAPASSADALANLDSVSAGDMFGTSASSAAGAGPGSLGGGSLGGGGAETVGGQPLESGVSGAGLASSGVSNVGGQIGGLGNAGSLSDGALGLNDLGGYLGAAYTLAKPQGRYAGTLSGASAGMQLYGPVGAIIGGALGYARNGGIPLANPKHMATESIAEADKEQNVTRMAGSPAAALAYKLGAGNGVVSALDKLDPFATLGHAFGGGQSKKRNWNAWNAANPGTTVNKEGNYVLPTGQVINQKQLDDLTGTWYGATYAPDGNQADWQKRYQDVLSGIGGGHAEGGYFNYGPMPPDLGMDGQQPEPQPLAMGRARGGPATTPLGLDLSSEPRYMQDGPGSGRGDEIDAKLSPKEYVMDAETVALLGDGNPDHGAKKLDEMRRKIRMHKGQKLAKGKFSPKAKNPEGYL